MGTHLSALGFNAFGSDWGASESKHSSNEAVAELLAFVSVPSGEFVRSLAAVAARVLNYLRSASAGSVSRLDAMSNAILMVCENTLKFHRSTNH
jgi:hypothetical protein